MKKYACRIEEGKAEMKGISCALHISSPFHPSISPGESSTGLLE